MKSKYYPRGIRSILFGLIALLGGVRICEAATFYVATTGSDSGSGSSSAPFRTINKGVSILKSGDTLYIRSGTYAEWLNNTIPGGTSWSSPVTVGAFPGDTVTIRPGVGADFVILLQGSIKKYIILDGLILDAVNVSHNAIKLTRPVVGPDAANHIRVKNCEIKNTPLTAIMTSGSSDFNEFQNLNIHNNGKVLDFNVAASEGLYHYAFYTGGSNNLIEGCDLYDHGSSAIQIYNGYTGDLTNNNIIRNNNIYSNTVKSSSQGRGAGIVLSSGSGHQVYNNIVSNNRAGIYITYSPNNKIFNNTIYNNLAEGVLVAGTSGVSVRNNIVYQNGSAIVNQATGTIQSNNLTADPLFANISTNDFRLRSLSPGIDSGMSVSEVLSDYEGVSRPKGVGYDIGAYEYTSEQDSPPTNLRIVSSSN